MKVMEVDPPLRHRSYSIDLNTPNVVDDQSAQCGGYSAPLCTSTLAGSKGCLFTRGGIAKQRGEVMKLRKASRVRRPNVVCRVERFGRICESFDDCRKSWVKEMGFGGLLYLVGLRLPRSLCYWLMTRVDAGNGMLNVGGLNFRLSCNQVQWVLGIPKGEVVVPRSLRNQELRQMVVDFEMKYGEECSFVDGRKVKVVTQKVLGLTPYLVSRIMSKFEADEVMEFKMLFLLVALELVLCPTQCNRFSKELVPALSCVGNPRKYNWCKLVFDKLMAGVTRFAKRFDNHGFAVGCGGCTLFLAIFYVDRLNRNPVCWGSRPRVKVWCSDLLKNACDADRFSAEGDFGCIGVLDVAYGEKHPRDARNDECVCSDDEAADK